MTFEFNSKDPFCATFDHIEPVSQRGTWDPENLLLAHQDCNNRRGNRRHVICLEPTVPAACVPCRNEEGMAPPL